MEQFVRTTDLGDVQLTEYAIELIRDRFQRFVHFILIDNDDIRMYGVRHVMTEDRKKLYDQYRSCISRLCGIARLPNVLLYGADVVGHDLSKAFSDMISNTEERELFLQKAERNKGIFAYRGRKIIGVEREAIRRHGLTVEEVISAYPSEDTYNFDQLCRAGEGYMVVFYNPTLMPQRLTPDTNFTSTLYPLPKCDAVEAVLIAWHKPFNV